MSEFKPFVPASAKMREFTPIPILMGVILGIVFGASSLYLALKVGMTVSASIPVAVLSITLFRGLSKLFGARPATILENNIVQTTGSAGESLAFGVAATMPALMILGFDMEVSRVMLVSVLGGLLGILMMIPLRKSLVEDGHKELIFPEGTACAQVLIVGEKGGASAKTVFIGFFVGLFYKLVDSGMHLWSEVAELPFKAMKGAVLSCEVAPELLGVGYIIGPRASNLMVAGGVLSSFVLIPAIYLFGGGSHEVLFPGTKPISAMAPHEIWRSYVLYIGAGAVAAAGIFSLLQALPTIVKAAKAGFAQMGLTRSGGGKTPLRTEQDIPMKWVLVGTVILIGAIWASPQMHVNIVGAVLILAFGFLFVTVSSRITGEIGSSSNPISGMTVATLLITSLIFLLLGWTQPVDRVAALTIAAVVCIAASNGGTTAQDLKTGYLVGGTPKWQQVGILIGALSSALVIGYTVQILNRASTIHSSKNAPHAQIQSVAALTKTEWYDGKNYHVLHVTEASAIGELAKVPPGKYLVDDSGKIRYLVDPGINGTLNARDDGTRVLKFEAPKARLMALIIDGILTQRLPWGLVLLGAFLVVMLELVGVGSLAFAVGVYLPFSSSMPIFVGGALRWLIDKIRSGRGEKAEDDSGPGVLLSSGLIAGGSIAGIGIALLSIREDWGAALDLGAKFPAIAQNTWTPVVAFVLLSAFVLQQVLGKKKAK